MMGNRSSSSGLTKAQQAKEKELDDFENFVFDPTYISWDEHGNLRYGLVHPVKRIEQLRAILKVDHVDDEVNKLNKRSLCLAYLY